MKPMEIEKQSFEIIARELARRGLKTDPEHDMVVRRVIHTTADFDYFENLTFSKHAMRALKSALQSGCDVVTDTTMAQAGINKGLLKRFGGQTRCFIADEDVREEAARRGVTRSWVCMEKAARLERPLILAIGNAPTALQAICALTRAGSMRPEAVIGVPVGFVNVVEAKEELMRLPVEYIVSRGRKGGSNVAAAIVNAALYQLIEREE